MFDRSGSRSDHPFPVPAPGRIDRLEYAWVQDRHGYNLVGSSTTDPAIRKRWHDWLAGLHDFSEGAKVRQPESVRCYLTDGTRAAVINRQREQGGSDTRLDIAVSVLVGSTEDLYVRLALRLQPWPTAERTPDRPYEPDQAGVWPLAALGPLRPPQDSGSPVPAEVAAPEIWLASPASLLGEVRLAEPLAVLTAAALEQLRRHHAGEPHDQLVQLVLVGADEPRARGLLLALTDVLAAVIPAKTWPTFSTFDAELPPTSATARDPALVFMPTFNPPTGASRPTAYAFLAPDLRPPNFTDLEFATPGTTGTSPLEQAARVLVDAYRQGGREWTQAAPALSPADLASHADQWADALHQWAIKCGLPRSQWAPRSPTSPASTTASPSEAPRHLHLQAPRDPSNDVSEGGGHRRVDETPYDKIDPPSRPEHTPPGDRGAFDRPQSPPTEIEFSEAETTLREAIRSVGGQPGELHTVDALVAAFGGRLWLSTPEDRELRPFLRTVFPRLVNLPAEPPSTRRRQASPVRPSSITALVDLARRHGSQPTDAGRTAAIDALAEILATNAPGADRGHLQHALRDLVDLGGSDHTHPDKAPTPEISPSPIGLDTIGEFGKQIVKACENAQRDLDKAQPRAFSRQAWVLWVLVDTLRDSVWLSEAAVDGLRTRLSTHLRLGTPQKLLQSDTRRLAFLDPATVTSVHDQATSIVADLTAQVTALGDTDYRGAADLLLDALTAISPDAVGGATATRRDDAIAAVRQAVDAFLPHGADPTEEARRRVHARFQDLVTRTTTAVDNLAISAADPTQAVAVAVLHLAAILPAAAWIPPAKVEPYINAVLRSLDTAKITYSEVSHSPIWAYDQPPEEKNVDLDAVRRDVRAHLAEARAELAKAGASSGLPPSLRDVTDVLAARLRKLALHLGAFDADSDAVIDRLHAAVNRRIRTWEEQQKQDLQRKLNTEKSKVAQLQKTLQDARAQPPPITLTNDRPPDRVPPDVAENLNAAAKRATEGFMSTRPGGNIAPFVQELFGELKATIPGVDTAEAVNALIGHAAYKPARMQDSRRPEPFGADEIRRRIQSMSSLPSKPEDLEIIRSIAGIDQPSAADADQQPEYLTDFVEKAAAVLGQRSATTHDQRKIFDSALFYKFYKEPTFIIFFFICLVVGAVSAWAF